MPNDQARINFSFRDDYKLLIRIFKILVIRTAAKDLRGQTMTKYNARKTVVDGIQFDSKAESEYYLLLKDLKEKGKVESFSLQPKFMLQEGFKKEGKVIRPIFYVADFDVIYTGGWREIIDVKGFETPDFKIKRKLFEKKYPYKLTLVKYVKKYGGWLSVDRWKELKREEKRAKK